jgi:hypothetical protein
VLDTSRATATGPCITLVNFRLLIITIVNYNNDLDPILVELIVTKAFASHGKSGGLLFP